MAGVSRRWPAEWEPHAATWLAWPHQHHDWPGKFEAIPWMLTELVRQLHRYERVEILCDSEQARAEACRRLASHGVDTAACGFHIVPTDRAWLRDSGPTGVLGANGLEWICWAFNGWARYEDYAKDQCVAAALAELSVRPAVEAVRPDGAGPLVLEGGGIEGNGVGTLLVTEEWLLSDVQVRNPGMTAADYERAFAIYLGASRTIWLGEGALGDDTHGHVDDVARFVDPNTVVLAWEPDPTEENHRRMVDNLRRLQLASRSHPSSLRVVKLPFPQPLVMDGERLPASYANFYIANGLVAVPTFNDPGDRIALNTLAKLFPTRAVVGIHSVDLVWGLGALHCLAQQQPIELVKGWAD
ncbi:MAG: agmatine deiminase family protein [Gemmatimonadota bacterium]|nr:agmatine deiminase family protein [Gemmatimonadota bacterium]